MMDNMNIDLPIDGRFSWMMGNEPNIRFTHKLWIASESCDASICYITTSYSRVVWMVLRTLVGWVMWVST